MFPNPLNPFQTDFPEDIKGIDKLASSPPSRDFVAVKVGDVNNTAIGHRPLGERPQALLSWPNFRSTVGQVITIPITYSGAEALEAIQLGLRFDPSVLQLLSPSLGDLPDWTADAFNLANAAQGEIRTIWLPADLSDSEGLAKQGNVLFYLTFKVVGASPESGVPLWLDDAVLPNAAWRTEGTECSLVRQMSAFKRSEDPTNPSKRLVVNCHPNPSSGDLAFSINAVEACKGRIAVFSPYGVRVFAHEVVLNPGTQEVNLPEAAQLPAGVYVWKFISGGIKAQGHWVKQ